MEMLQRCGGTRNFYSQGANEVNVAMKCAGGNVCKLALNRLIAFRKARTRTAKRCLNQDRLPY